MVMAEDVASPTRSTPSPTAVNKSSGPTSGPPRLNTASPVLRNRLLNRAAAASDASDMSNRRRSSMLSVSSLEDARNSIRSSTDDLLLPKADGPMPHNNHEPSVWHSSPLIFALLPAVGGMVFKNGSAVVTDITLLALAAVFLNWSVRLPWDWYRSAQSVATQEPYAPDALVEESEDEEEEDEDVTAVQEDAPPREEDTTTKQPRSRSHPYRTVHESANKELRVHELLALLSCFLFPLLGAYLLHTIRRQLSRPSEGLVSDYNLTIFILAAEVRPLAHLIKIIQSRTLFLQRRVNQNPYLSQPDSSTDPNISDLLTRLADLEAHAVTSTASVTSPTSATSRSSPTSTTLTTEVRRTLQPDLDALNRAVRRYEKRATMQTMQTESRLVDLEMRLNDALSLAAAAAQSGQRQRHGFSAILVDWVCAVVVLPIQGTWALASLPLKVITSTVSIVGGWATRTTGIGIGAKRGRPERRSATGRLSGHGRLAGERMQARGLKKVEWDGAGSQR